MKEGHARRGKPDDGPMPHPTRSSWRGACSIDGEAEITSWRECEVLHISMRGMGLYLRHPWPADIVGRAIEVRLPADADSLSARLKGTVKNAVVSEAGFARVTVEFWSLPRPSRPSPLF